MKAKERWHSPRMNRNTTLVRWGTYGQPVLLFPTAGGDAEEIERFLMIQALGPLVEQGKVKVYSCDSVGGQVMLAEEGTPQFRQWMMNQFHHYVRQEVVPAIRQDCRDPNIEIITAGASIGAFNAAAVTCRFPDVFKLAIAMSGTYDLRPFYRTDKFIHEFWLSSPLHFLPKLDDDHRRRLQSRFILMPSGEGKAESIGQSWALANVLGRSGIPNRVDSWGPQTPHDWVTWRAMLPQYLDRVVNQRL